MKENTYTCYSEHPWEFSPSDYWRISGVNAEHAMQRYNWIMGNINNGMDNAELLRAAHKIEYNGNGEGRCKRSV